MTRPVGGDYTNRWDQRNRKRTKNPEEAEKILNQTGRMPRPMRLSDVRMGAAPIKKTIVASALERRKAAEMVKIYAVTRLQARLLLRREVHPVWRHERVMVYGKLVADFLQPDSNTNEPMELTFPLKFRAAFRENADPYVQTLAQRWDNEMERRDMRPDLVEGKQIEALIKGKDPSVEVPENMFAECILDNVVDLGELVLQHWACHIDRTVASIGPAEHGLQRRMSRRLTKELGREVACDIQEDESVRDRQPLQPPPQVLHDSEPPKMWFS